MQNILIDLPGASLEDKKIWLNTVLRVTHEKIAPILKLDICCASLL